MYLLYPDESGNPEGTGGGEFVGWPSAGEIEGFCAVAGPVGVGADQGDPRAVASADDIARAADVRGGVRRSSSVIAFSWAMRVRRPVAPPRRTGSMSAVEFVLDFAAGY
jgi:hypothetical protein